MYAEAGGQHHIPHFHAYYGADQAVYSIQPIELLEGELPRPQHRQVLEWAQEHQPELLAAWKSLRAGRSPKKIA